MDQISQYKLGTGATWKRSVCLLTQNYITSTTSLSSSCKKNFSSVRFLPYHYVIKNGLRLIFLCIYSESGIDTDTHTIHENLVKYVLPLRWHKSQLAFLSLCLYRWLRAEMSSNRNTKTVKVYHVQSWIMPNHHQPTSNAHRLCQWLSSVQLCRSECVISWNME